MEEEVKSPFAYLLVAMNYAKAAVENGGKVDMFNVHSLIDFGYGEGEMFFLAKGYSDAVGIDFEQED